MIIRLFFMAVTLLLGALSAANSDIIRRDSNGDFSAPGLGSAFRCQTIRDQVIFSKMLVTPEPLEILQIDEGNIYPIFKGHFVPFHAECQGEASNTPSQRTLRLICREELAPGRTGETDINLEIHGDRGELLITRRGPVGRSSRWVLAGCQEVTP